MNQQPLLTRILGRNHSLFAEDFAAHHKDLSRTVRGSHLLVIGAAGSIGRAFVRQVVALHPARLHLVDPSENNLVELVRELRSADLDLPVDFKTFAIAMGSLPFERFLADHPPYSHTLNFAALKHVRSERDPYTLMRLLETNVLAVDALLSHPSMRQKNFFSVSSDKAVNPQNAMGASKAFMERVMLTHSEQVQVTSSRFANVAFSDGSLLDGFQYRLQKGQPLAAPSDVRRYFISHEEAGQLCLLACFLGENKDIFFPKPGDLPDLITFSEIATLFLQEKGYQAKNFSTAEAARAFAAQRDPKSPEWPCHFAPSDTTGEKPFEEFYTQQERVNEKRFKKIGLTSPPLPDPDQVRHALKQLHHIQTSPQWSRQEMLFVLQSVVPELLHGEKNRDLDQKM
ncbi:MAG: polysaccharide biosynthesis protein [Magnetococcus sp. DMHC-6]